MGTFFVEGLTGPERVCSVCFRSRSRRSNFAVLVKRQRLLTTTFLSSLLKLPELDSEGVHEFDLGVSVDSEEIPYGVIFRS